MNICPHCAYECADEEQYCVNCGKLLLRKDNFPSVGNKSVGDGIIIDKSSTTIMVDSKTIYDNCKACGKPLKQDESYRCPVCAQSPLCRNCFSIEKRKCRHCIDELQPDDDLNKGSKGPHFSGLYRIVARHSGKALDVANGGQDNGTNVWQWSLHDYDNQKWELVHIKDDYYQIVARHSGKALDVSGYSHLDGANVFQWRLHSGTNQQWELVPIEDGYYHIIARHSGKALDVEGYGQEDGANVFQWRLHGGTDQQWRLEPILPDDIAGRSVTDRAKQALFTGKSHIKTHRYNDAINELTKAVELDPQSAEAYRQRGIAYRRSRRTGSAIADYTRAIELQPEWAEAYRNRGRAFKDNKEYGKAIADFTRAIELDPRTAETYYNRGETHHLQHDDKRAIADLERCLKLNPGREHAKKLLNHIKGKEQRKKSGKKK